MATTPLDLDVPGADVGRRGEWRTVLRHRLPLRVMHWINLLCMLVLVGSGLQIFNAHPALYWGRSSTFDAPAVARPIAARGPDGKARGITAHRRRAFDTTGVLGVSSAPTACASSAGFPEWATIPGPALAGAGPALAFLLRMAVGDQRRVLRAMVAGQPAPRARPVAMQRATGARSARRSSITCASGIRSARRPRATTRCRNSRTWRVIFVLRRWRS